MIRSSLLGCALFATAFAARAQEISTPTGVIALTPEQREAAIEAGVARARDESLQNGISDRRVHGEVGVEVGSRGERAVYGTMVAPIGQNGVAAISYANGQGPRWHGRGRGRYRGSSFSAAYSSEAWSAPPSPSSQADQTDPD